MNEDEDFAAALAQSLGPLYRVALLDANGDQIAGFGRPQEGRSVGEPIPLPRGSGSIRIEVDQRSIQGPDRVLHDLVATASPPETALGAFTHLDDALDHLIAEAEVRIGKPIGAMSRAERQRLVGYLDERGAFVLRKAVERVAEMLGSRASRSTTTWIRSGPRR
jgi:DNA binding protein with HTH domain